MLGQIKTFLAAALPAAGGAGAVRRVKAVVPFLAAALIPCLLACGCGRLGTLIESLMATPSSENLPGVYKGKNYGGEEEIVLRKDGTFSHNFVREGSVVATNDGTWLFAKDSTEIVFSSAGPADWPAISPDEKAHSRYLGIWEGRSCSLTVFRDDGRKDVEKAANLVYSLDSPEEYWLWKAAADTEE